MRGIPTNPVDGQQYAGLFGGWPSVLEYDSTTGAFKLIVDAEIGEAIVISGSVDINADILVGNQYAEDSPHTSGATGTFILNVRQDAPMSMVTAEGDYAPFISDALGRLHVFTSGSYFTASLNQIVDTHVLNQQINAQYAEDSGFVGGSTGTFVLAVRNDQMDSYASDDGDFSTLNTDAFGRLYTWTTGSFTYVLGTVATQVLNPEINAQYAEDSVHVSGATGTFTLSVRQDNAQALVNAEGDYAPFITDDLGRLHTFTSGSYSGFITGSSVGIAGQTKVINRAVVNITGSAGEFEIVAAVAAQRIKVTSLMLVTQVNTNMVLQSGWTGTAITGVISLPADGDGFFLNTPSTTDQFHFQSEPGENLVLDSTETFVAGGWIQYYTEA